LLISDKQNFHKVCDDIAIGPTLCGGLLLLIGTPVFSAVIYSFRRKLITIYPLCKHLFSLPPHRPCDNPEADNKISKQAARVVGYRGNTETCFSHLFSNKQLAFCDLSFSVRKGRRWEDNIKMDLQEVGWGHGLDSAGSG
jgi:hypothetical protein